MAFTPSFKERTAEDLLEHFAVLKGLVDRRQRREVVDGLLRQVNLWDARKRTWHDMVVSSVVVRA